MVIMASEANLDYVELKAIRQKKGKLGPAILINGVNFGSFLEYNETSLEQHVCKVTFVRLFSEKHLNQVAFLMENDGNLIGHIC